MDSRDRYLAAVYFRLCRAPPVLAVFSAEDGRVNVTLLFAAAAQLVRCRETMHQANRISYASARSSIEFQLQLQMTLWQVHWRVPRLELRNGRWKNWRDRN